MSKRIESAYVGTVLTIFGGLPIAIISSGASGGHSIMFLFVFGVPIGMTIGLIYADRKTKNNYLNIALRSLLSIIIYIVIVYAVGSIKSWNNGWVLLIFSPLIISLLTKNIFIFKQNGGT